MFSDASLAYNSLGAWSEHQGPHAVASKTHALYDRVRHAGLLERVLTALGHGPELLRPLPGGPAARVMGPVAHGQTQTVPIERIRGSESRCRDFDRDFRPVQKHTEERWRSVAAARVRGQYLPPVELLALGDEYYVRDGHHRISVARALGEQFIEATVMACG